MTLLLLTLSAAMAQAQGPTAQRRNRARQLYITGRATDPRLREVSGMVASRKYPGIYWAHGDSGNAATLFALRSSGEVVAAVPIADAPNVDWEDLAIDGDGNLYVGDIGNNNGWLPMRYVYRIPEPDPFARPVAAARWTQRYRYRFPNKRFDAESLVVMAGNVFLVSKPRQGSAALYRLEAREGDLYEPVMVAPLPLHRPTGADLTPDGDRLVVCGSGSLTLIALDDEHAPRLDQGLPSMVFDPGGVEACCFDGDHVRFATESGYLYAVPVEVVEAQGHFRRRIDPPPKPDG